MSESSAYYYDKSRFPDKIDWERDKGIPSVYGGSLKMGPMLLRAGLEPEQLRIPIVDEYGRAWLRE